MAKHDISDRVELDMTRADFADMKRAHQEEAWDEAMEHLHGIRVISATEYEIGLASNPHRKEGSR